jgi:hypothetical protein
MRRANSSWSSAARRLAAHGAFWLPKSRSWRSVFRKLLVFGERHLRHLLGPYQKYYNDARTHLSLNKDAPASRAVQAVGRIVPTPHLGGLHHQYSGFDFR